MARPRPRPCHGEEVLPASSSPWLTSPFALPWRILLFSNLKWIKVQSSICSSLHQSRVPNMAMSSSDTTYLLRLTPVAHGPVFVVIVLPGLLTAIAENLKVHITKQCSVCQDTGEWCGSGILCEDPFSPIFPFQEEDVTNCKTCHATFHKKCFQKCISCPSCSKDWSNKATDAGKSSGACQDEELHDYGGLTAVSDGQSIAKNVSSSSVEPEFQSSSSELEKESHNKRSWDFHNLLSKRRL